MSNSPSDQSRSSIRRLSRSRVGATTSRLKRMFGGSATLQAGGRFLRRQLWLWPILAGLIIGGANWWVSRTVENAMRQQRVDELTTILNADVAALRNWMQQQEAVADLVARDEKLQPLVEELLSLATDKMGGEVPLIHAPAQKKLRERLAAALERSGFVGYFLVSPSAVVVAADQDPPIGKPLGGYRGEFFTHVLQGKPSVSKPYRSPLLLKDEKGELRANLPTMFAAASIPGADGKPIAVLGLRIRPDDHFTRILQVAQSGNTGETYAFDREGLMLSQSRFDEELKQIGLLVDQPDSQSILTLELRDPQVNMPAGERPALRRAQQPLTKMAAAAVTGEPGHDADGYRDYRGVPVVGAWQWLPEFDFGVATEKDVSEAFRPVYILRGVFWVLMGLLILAAIVIFVAMLWMARQQKALQLATLAAKQIGQYSLEGKLGAGGMGTVYKARHAMLRRPTAVKLLDVEKISDAAVVRFEREVQMTSGLTHPNTVAVYDYGRTPEGIFYYAMEYLEGINLDDLVSRHGPLPEARAVYILRQVCGSLAEAHVAGLVHRDIKPANIFLTTRGGIQDFVKVLDFGLVKALAGGSEQANLTSANAVTGTPLYLSPEAVNEPENVDARSDVYSIGAVGYYLLTGTPVFGGSTVMEICLKHVQAEPQPPSARSGRPVSAGLEAIVLRCLAKSRDARPRDAAELLHELDQCAVTGRWTAEDAAAWWTIHGAGTRTVEQVRAADTVRPAVTSELPRPDTTMEYRPE